MKPGTATALTKRELAILELMANGNGSKAIAAILGGSPATIDNHRGRICSKLGASNAAHCVWLGVLKGYLHHEGLGV